MPDIYNLTRHHSEPTTPEQMARLVDVISTEVRDTAEDLATGPRLTRRQRMHLLEATATLLRAIVDTTPAAEWDDDEELSTAATAESSES